MANRFSQKNSRDREGGDRDMSLFEAVEIAPDEGCPRMLNPDATQIINYDL
jgi:hypothetical protein